MFPNYSGPVQKLAESLPAQLRDTDTLCRPVATEVLMLTAGTSASFGHVRRRLLALWDKVWRASSETGPAPPLRNEFVEMSASGEADAFLATVTHWLAAGDRG